MTKNIYYTNGPKMVQKWSKIKRYRVSNITYRTKTGLFWYKMYKKKTKVFNKNLEKYSIETVQMFFNDAKESGFKI